MASYYGFWNYWNLYHKVTFDGVNRLILINEGVTDVDVLIDLYSAWKEWSLIEDNTKYLNAFSVNGGDPLPGNIKLDATFFLINGWKIKPYPGTYDLQINGNLYDRDGASIKVPADINPLFPNNISVNLNLSTIVRRVDVETTSTGSGEYTGIVTASLVPPQSQSLSNIETLAIAQSASLQAMQLTIDIMNQKLIELWQVHGLDPTASLYVNKTSRVVGDIVQVIVNNGTGSAAETTIARI
jgi:hypothetical protein